MIPKKYRPENLSAVHNGRYLYTLYEYKGSEVPATFICPEHGEFEQIPYSHAKGRGCMLCAAQERAARSNASDFSEKARAVHGRVYLYDDVDYINARTKVRIICSEHGEFWQTPDAHLRGQGCPSCGNVKKGMSRRNVHVGIGHSDVSIGWDCSLLLNHLHESLGGETSRIELLGNGQEIDLWFPDERVGFEINGVYWHSSLHKGRHYHQDKTELARDNNISLYHIWYDRDTDFDLVFSWAKNKLGRETTRVPARKTSIQEVSTQDYREFLDRNHLQGAIDARVRLGLVFDGEVVAVMGFKKHTDGWHLSRFAARRHTVVQGGFSKLLAYFRSTFSPEKIISYSDESYSGGGVYEKHGFVKASESSGPRLYYTDGRKLVDRWHFQRSNVMRRNPGMEMASEKEMALREGFYQLYGCKTVRWELSIDPCYNDSV